jgi:hypothetical protein
MRPLFQTEKTPQNFADSHAVVARELAPAGLRSGPKSGSHGFSDAPHAQVLRLLRSRTGASSLATGSSLASRIEVICSGQLIPDTSIGGFDAIVRS